MRRTFGAFGRLFDRAGEVAAVGGESDLGNMEDFERLFRREHRRVTKEDCSEKQAGDAAHGIGQRSINSAAIMQEVYVE